MARLCPLHPRIGPELCSNPKLVREGKAVYRYECANCGASYVYRTSLPDFGLVRKLRDDINDGNVVVHTVETSK